MKKSSWRILTCFIVGLIVLPASWLIIRFALSLIPREPLYVVLISIDTLRSDHLGCYGYSKNTSPNIDRFSKDSVIFMNNIAQAPNTLPSHASMFTSLIPSHHGVVLRSKAIPEEIITIGDVFKDFGYGTVGFVGGGEVSAKFGFDQGFDIYKTLKLSKDKPDNSFRMKVDAAVDYIRANPESKCFFFLHTYEVHTPYMPREKHLALFEDDYSGPLPKKIGHPIVESINSKKIKMTKQDKEHIINCYNAEIYSMDQAFGVFVEFLKKQDLYDDTMIIFTSDHGEELGERGKMAVHTYTLYDELLRVPLIIKFPRSKHAGTIVHDQTASLDILPTLLELFHMPLPERMEGNSLMNCIEDNRMHPPFTVSQRNAGHGKISSCIRTNEHKLWEERLFNLKNDPRERKDVAAQYTTQCKMLQKRLDDCLQAWQPYETKKTQLDDETLQELKALGYVE
jgi:arylsulfatase A-like enzyme